MSIVASILLVLAFGLSIVVSAALYVLASQSRYVHKTCSDYTSSQYKEVVSDYKKGNLRLDRNRDGIPCGFLIKK